MEEVIIEEEQQREEMTNEPLFPRLEELVLRDLPKLGHFFQTKHALEFSFLRIVKIESFPEMKTFVLGSMSTPGLKSLFVEKLVRDAEVKNDISKAVQQMFNSKVSCPSMEELYLWGPHSITVLCSHQLPAGYFNKLKQLEVSECGKLRNLMSPSVARGVLNLRRLEIRNCPSMEEVITEKEQQGEEMTNEPLFPWLGKLVLNELLKLGHFFLTKRALEFPFFRNVKIESCPEMKTFSLGSVSTQRLKYLSIDESIRNAKVKNDLNKPIQQRFNSKEQEASDGRS